MLYVRDVIDAKKGHFMNVLEEFKRYVKSCAFGLPEWLNNQLLAASERWSRYRVGTMILRELKNLIGYYSIWLTGYTIPFGVSLIPYEIQKQITATVRKWLMYAVRTQFANGRRNRENLY